MKYSTKDGSHLVRITLVTTPNGRVLQVACPAEGSEFAKLVMGTVHIVTVSLPCESKFFPKVRDVSKVSQTLSSHNYESLPELGAGND